MSDARIVVVILIGLVALGSGGAALVHLIQTVAGLGSGGLAFTGMPILVLGLICALSVVGITALLKHGADDGD